MIGLAEIIHKLWKKEEPAKKMTENEFMQWRFDELKDIRIKGEEAKDPYDIQKLVHRLSTMYFSQHLAEKYPVHYEYEKALLLHLNTIKTCLGADKVLDIGYAEETDYKSPENIQENIVQEIPQPNQYQTLESTQPIINEQPKISISVDDAVSA